MQDLRTTRAAVAGNGDITLDWGPQGLQATDARPKPVWARLTGNTSNRYSWVQVNETDTSFPDLGSSFGTSGTVNQWPAYEVTGNTGVAAGAKVQLWPSPAGTFWLFFAGTGSGYTRVQEEGSDLTQRATLNFIGPNVTASDNAGSTRTDVTHHAGAKAQAGYVTTTDQEKTGKWTVVGSTTAHATDRPSVVTYVDGGAPGTHTASVSLYSDEGNGTGLTITAGEPLGQVFAQLTFDTGSASDTLTMLYEGGPYTGSGLNTLDMDDMAIFGENAVFTNLSGTNLGVGVYASFLAAAAAGVPNNSLFHDVADGKLKWKDSGGTVNALY